MVAGALFGHAKTLVAFWVVLLELVAAIYVLRATRRVDPVWIVVIAMVLIPFQWHQLGVAISPHRILLPAALIVLALRMPGARHRYDFEFRPAHAALMLAGLYAILSAVSAGDLFDKAAFYALLDNYGLLAFLMFFAAPVLFHKDWQRGLLIGAMVILGGYLGILAILESAHAWGLIVPHYIANPSVGIHFGRARGPFVQAGDDGLAMFECAVLAVLGYLRWSGWRKFGCASVAALCALGVLLTQTRGAWIAAGAGALVTMVAFKPLRAYLLPVLLALFLGLGGVLLAAPGLRSKISGRTSDQGPIWVRKTLDDAAFRMIEARPLVGFGWATFKKRSDAYIRQGSDYPIQGADEPSHNTYLNIAVELGLLGALIWAVAILSSLGTAIIRRGPPELYQWRMAACAMAVSWLVAGLFGPAPYSFEIIMTFMTAGIASGLRNPRIQWPAPVPKAAPPDVADPMDAEAETAAVADWGFDEPVVVPVVRPLEIAFLTTVLPDGLTTGAEVVSQSFIAALRGAGHHLRVVGYGRPGQPVTGEDVVSAGTRPTDAAGASLIDRGAWARAALRLKVPFSVARFESDRYTLHARELLADPAIDLVVVDGADMGWLVPELKTARKRIVFISHGRESLVPPNGSAGTPARLVAEREWKLMSQVERSLVDLAAEVWTVSPDEAARLGERARVFAAPGAIDVTSNGAAPRPSFDVGLLGNWASRPNSESLRWFVEHVVPLLPVDTSVHVAGRGAPPPSAGVVVRGFVPDAGEFAERARVIAVPAVETAGLPVRTVDAIAAGGWVVASPPALNGIAAPPATVGVADAPEAFAAEITAALLIAPDPQARAEALLWASARRAAFDAAVADAVARVAASADQVTT